MTDDIRTLGLALAGGIGLCIASIRGTIWLKEMMTDAFNYVPPFMNTYRNCFCVIGFTGTAVILFTNIAGENSTIEMKNKIRKPPPIYAVGLNTLIKH